MLTSPATSTDSLAIQCNGGYTVDMTAIVAATGKMTNPAATKTLTNGFNFRINGVWTDLSVSGPFNLLTGPGILLTTYPIDYNQVIAPTDEPGNYQIKMTITAGRT
jgi:hypothetical protein